jgi:hypothetical protein
MNTDVMADDFRCFVHYICLVVKDIRVEGLS